MKKASKTLFKVVGIIAAVGLLLVIVSLAMGADFREAQIEMTGSFKTDDVKLVSREVRLSPEQVRGLELEIGSGEVEIKRIVEWNLSDDRDERGNPRNGTEEERRTAWDAVVFANPFGFPMTTAPIEISEGGRETVRRALEVLR